MGRVFGFTSAADASRTRHAGPSKIYGFTGERRRFLGIESWKWNKLKNHLTKPVIKLDSAICWFIFTVLVGFGFLAYVAAITPLTQDWYADYQTEAADKANKFSRCISWTNDKNICRAAFLATLPRDYVIPTHVRQ